MAYTLLDYAFEVLSRSNKPLTRQEIWEKGLELKLGGKIKTTGKTPWQSLYSNLYVDVQNSKSRFIKVGNYPARFFLKVRKKELHKDFINDLEVRVKSKQITTHYSEKDLYPLLSYFTFTSPIFAHGKSVLTKTILHENSKKGGYNEWLHPDVVGFYTPIDDWDRTLIDFSRVTKNNDVRIYSFEVKKELNKSNYREAFFQAVSNSSWAHEGYLVAANILQDDDLYSELERLSMAFGIGIIYLDIIDINSSKVLFTSKTKSDLDWETMNKLCEQNPDFNKFVRDIKADYEVKRIHNSEYNEILLNTEEYIKKLKLTGTTKKELEKT